MLITPLLVPAAILSFRVPSDLVILLMTINAAPKQKSVTIHIASTTIFIVC